MIEELYLYACRYFVFDDIKELDKLLKYAPKAKKVLRIFIVDIIQGSIEYGMRLDTFKKMCEDTPRYLDVIDGVTFYVRKNKNILNLLKVLDLADNYFSMIKSKVKILNIGGNYRLIDEVGSEYYRILNERLLLLKDKHKLQLMTEPGHVIIKSAGVLTTKVVLTKKVGTETYIFIDAGTPTGATFEPDEINIKNHIALETIETNYKFYGITCSHQLLFSKNLKYTINEGDILEFINYGSYTICLSNNFHSWHRPYVLIE